MCIRGGDAEISLEIRIENFSTAASIFVRLREEEPRDCYYLSGQESVICCRVSLSLSSMHYLCNDIIHRENTKML